MTRTAPNKLASHVRDEAVELTRQYAREASDEGAFSVSGHFWELARRIKAIPIRSAGKPKPS